MSISYFGHCACEVAEAQRRTAFIRAARPEWFGPILHLSEATAVETAFERELSRDFGVEARCRFLLSVLDKDRRDCLPEAIDFIYRVFGSEDLVISRELDLIHPPLRHYRPMEIG